MQRVGMLVFSLRVVNYGFLAIKVSQYITVTLGKWLGDRYIQGDHYIKVSFQLYWKLMDITLMEIFIYFLIMPDVCNRV